MAAPVATGAQVFNLTTPYLTQGITSDERARTDLLRVWMKVYADGGENLMHAHVHEDHTFIVLEGEATFHIDSEDNVRVLRPNEGVLLPKGTFYRFQSSGQGNLVMLRVGASLPGTGYEAVYPDGVEKAAKHEPWGKVDRTERPGRQFGEVG
jgi:mannose-6-phosphate isomerase-like protein (cupin superfamily)